jgi:hypothetical protein
MSFRPQDSVQLMLAGQAVLFNVLTVESAGDVLCGMAGPVKSRARSNVTAMGRIVSRHLDTLVKLQGRLNRAATQADITEQIPATPAEPPPPQAAPDNGPLPMDEHFGISVTEAPAELPLAGPPLAEPALAEPSLAGPPLAGPPLAEPPVAEPALSKPEPAPAVRHYPGRETMLASRPFRVSRRNKTRLAHKLMNVLRAAQTP